jgi:hypothetical protein
MKTEKTTLHFSSDDSTLNLSAPRSWKELSAGQLAYISWLMTNKQPTKEELHTHALIRFTGIQVIHKKNGYWLCFYRGRYFTLSPEQAFALSRQFSWLTGAAGEVAPLPTLAGIAHQEPRLRGLPFAQYLACENYYQAFIHTRDEKYLNRLIASFYLGDKEFDDSRTEELSRQFAGIPFHIRHTAFLWYYGLKSVFQTHFPHFFQKAAHIPEQEPQAPDMRGHINNMIRALTGGDVTKTGAVYRTETWTALAELDAKALEYSQMEARMKRIKN